MDSNPRSPVTGPKLIRDCRRVTSASLATGRYSRPRICRCIGASTHGPPDIEQSMDRAEDRLAHPPIRAADRPYPRSVIAGTDAFVCRDLAGLRGRTRDVMRFL